MTENEAKDFIEQLKSGKTFSSSFQSNEWGIKYRGENEYILWSKMIDYLKQFDSVEKSKEEYNESIKTEDELIKILMINYDYNTMLPDLKDN